MKKMTLLMITAILAGFSLYAEGEEKPKPAPKPRANYRKSQYRKATTIKNPYAITSTSKVANKEATAAFNKFCRQCYALNRKKDYSSIHGAVDEFLGNQTGLTANQKSMAVSFKVKAYMSDKDYQQAFDTAQEAMAMKCDNTATHAADAIRAARLMKEPEKAKEILDRFEKSGNYANAAFYSAAADLSFDLKNNAAAFEYLKNYGKQPRLGIWDQVTILNGFGRYYRNLKRYNVAIAQYNAILGLPKANAQHKDNAMLQIAYCYMHNGQKAEATETFNKLTKSRTGYIRNTARREYQKLTRKPSAGRNRKRR